MSKTLMFKIIYSFIILVSLGLLIFSPILIQSGVSIKTITIGEEIIQEALIISLLLITYITFRFYKKSIVDHINEIKSLEQKKKSLEEQLEDSLRYIGRVNVQIQEIQSLFAATKKFPENKKDFRNILKFNCEKILGIINVDWVIIRIINPDNYNTLSEHNEARGSAVLLKHELSNKEIVNNELQKNLCITCSDQDNLTIKVFCVLPAKKISNEQDALVKTILNQLEMLFVVFTSQYYKEGYLKNNRKQI
ncbi:hypothetical protein ACFLZ9_01920 [Patescibacteria group bacterium]